MKRFFFVFLPNEEISLGPRNKRRFWDTEKSYNYFQITKNRKQQNSKMLLNIPNECSDYTLKEISFPFFFACSVVLDLDEPYHWYVLCWLLLLIKLTAIICCTVNISIQCILHIEGGRKSLKTVWRGTTFVRASAIVSAVIRDLLMGQGWVHAQYNLVKCVNLDLIRLANIWIRINQLIGHLLDGLMVTSLW